ncbi:MAG TPA: hypothetical protein VFV98_01345 [Vicinamibacterales bacterium]|nr:hypothetical protein [Vicinamibacterales bacterium]
MKATARMLPLVLGALVPMALLAQTTAVPAEFNVLTVYREAVKAGKGDPHDAHEEGWAGALAAAKNPTGFLAATSMTGPDESWYFSPYADWAAYEKATKVNDANATLTAIDKRYRAVEGDYLTDARQMILTAMRDLSYGAPADMAASRYFSVTRITVRPGHTAEYEEGRRMVKGAHESAKLKDAYSLWRVAAGAPGGTYYQFVARKSLAELDEGAAIHGAAYQAALGGADGQKKLDAITASAVVSTQVDLFAFAPQQSIPPAEWIKADPGFWTHKAPVKKVQ